MTISSTMSSKDKDYLFILIKSLSQAEKRSFKLYVKRFEANENAKFIKLFDILGKLGVNDEQIDFARILYNKGLYQQSLKLLGKAKSIAERYFLDTIVLRIVELEKVIESQHITRSMRDRAEILAGEAGQLTKNVSLKNALSN